MKSKKILMLVPANRKVNLTKTSLNLLKSVQNKEIAIGLIQPVQKKPKKGSACLSIAQVEDLLSQGLRNKLLEEIFALCDTQLQTCDVLLVQGLQHHSDKPYVRSLNIDIAKALSAEVVVLANTNKRHQAKIEKQIKITINTYQSSLKQKVVTYKLDTLLTSADGVSLVSAAKFRYQLMQTAIKANKRIVLPESDDIRILKAAQICAERKIARCVLLGKSEKIHQDALANGFELSQAIEIIDPDTIRDNYVEPLVKLRKHKGMTPALAKMNLQDNMVLGTMMLQLDDVDGFVAGAVTTTADTIRPALQLIKTKPEAKIVSAALFMCLPEQVLVYSDCALNPDPGVEALADIAIQTADSSSLFGIDPRVAMISYSTGNSAAGPSIEKVNLATAMVKEKRPEILIDGPLQYDAAVASDVARQKAPNSPLAGNSTVFIFPDLDAANITYKAVQRSSNILSIGPMLQGLCKPVNDLSRGALVEDIVYTIAVTAIQATH